MLLHFADVVFAYKLKAKASPAEWWTWCTAVVRHWPTVPEVCLYTFAKHELGSKIPSFSVTCVSHAFSGRLCHWPNQSESEVECAGHHGDPQKEEAPHHTSPRAGEREETAGLPSRSLLLRCDQQHHRLYLETQNPNPHPRPTEPGSVLHRCYLSS